MSTNKEEFCDMVKEIVTKDRTNYNKAGGEDSFRIIADLWNYYMLYSKGINIEYTESDVCMMMIMLKQARLFNNPKHTDSIIDIAGYSAIYYDKILGENNAETNTISK